MEDAVVAPPEALAPRDPLPAPDPVQLLRDDPTSFSFFQAVRLLERDAPHRARVGRFGDPADEAVRFGAHASIAFPASEIQALEVSGSGAPTLLINAFGVIGPQGTLPYWYTLLVAEQLRARRTSLRAFLDIFQHRIISHFYRAWAKPRAAVEYERGGEDRFTHLLRALAGLGPTRGAAVPRIPDETILFYSGLLGSHRRSAVALEQLLGDYFGVPASVEQFTGGWYEVPDESLCRIGTEDEMTTLGVGALVGDEIWDPQMRVQIRLGPLSRTQFDAFLPTGPAHEELRELTRLFAGDEIDFAVLLVLARDDVPACVLGDEEGGVQLGWSSWLRTAPFARDVADAILSL